MSLNSKNLTLILFSSVTLVVVIYLSLSVGIYPFSLSDIRSFLLNDQQTSQYLVFWELRLPRTLIALFGGAALATAGHIMQSVLKNPLASPNLTGVMSGAAFAVLTATMFVLPLSSLFWGIAGGFIGGVITLSISWKNGITPSRLALAGVSVSAFCQAAITYILLSDRVDSEALFFWLTGSNAGANWDAFWPLLFTTLPMFALLIVSYRQRSYLELDDEVARGLGIPINSYRLLFGFISVILTAASVGAFGPVGFIGLVAPHLARMLGLGLIGSAAIGASLVITADLLARTLLMPLELPIGVLTAMIGAPWFLYLILGKLRMAR
ncbi:ferrichrome transport system permease protein fhuB [Vibrio sp. JCM 19236]|nr:ferrichrome transport system permease protein fhuB [Vibrio sp. JCM 19236]